MKRRTKIIIVIIILILVLLLFVRLTGFIIRSTGTSVNSCSDSDDGREYWKKGHVVGEYTFLRTEGFYFGDFCEDDRLLVEYYCVDIGIDMFRESIEYECPYGCEDGKCLGEEIEISQKISFFTKIKRIFRF